MRRLVRGRNNDEKEEEEWWREGWSTETMGNVIWENTLVEKKHHLRPGYREDEEEKKKKKRKQEKEANDHDECDFQGLSSEIKSKQDLRLESWVISLSPHKNINKNYKLGRERKLTKSNFIDENIRCLLNKTILP